MFKLKMFGTAACAVAALLLSISASNAAIINVYSGPFYLNLNATSTDAISNIVEYSVGPQFSSTGQFDIPAGGPSAINNPFVFPGPSYDYGIFLVGIVSGGTHNGGLAIFTNTSFNGVGSFISLFPGYNEAQLVAELQIANPTGPDVAELDSFGFNNAAANGFVPGSAFSIFAYSDGGQIGSGTSSAVAATPLPSTWLMLLSGFIGFGYFAYRGTMKRTVLAAA